MYGCILFTGKTGQCSDIAPDEREAEPGAGLLGNVTRTFRGLETLGGHKDWFGRSWSERIHWQVLAWRKGRGIQSFLPARSQIGAKFLHTYLVFEDGSSISPRVARVPLPANEADRPSCSSSVVSGVPNRKCCAR